MEACPNLHTASLGELVAWYNRNSNLNPLKAFRNRAQAQERCMLILSGADPADYSSPAAQLEAANKPRKRPEPADDNLVHLKQLCFDLDLEPRIARRRLRKALGNVGTGSRWSWAPESPELAKVRSILAGAPAADE